MTRKPYEAEYGPQICAFTRYLGAKHPKDALDWSDKCYRNKKRGRTFSEWINDMHKEFEAQTGLSAKWDHRQLRQWFENLCR